VILAITYRDDEHAPPLLDALARRGAEVVVLDLADLPRHGRLALSYGAAGGRRELRLDGRPPIDAAAVTGVWWRRPQAFAAAPGLHPDDAAFAIRQTNEAVMGLFASLAPHARLVNHPWRDAVGVHKTYQLAAGERAGLRVPATVVTSDPAEARSFLEARGEGGAVHKAVHATPADWRVTRRVSARDLDRLEALRLSPVIFQEHVPGVDVRVTAVGDELFAAEIDARATSSPDDFRAAFDDCRVAPCALPDAEASGLRALLRELGLLYAAVDFRRRDDGAWFFLEVNPAGQWLFVEVLTGQPITEALAALLAGG
jgi:glutathione synthase/RimK-type ligase-like ATP-grasp enzyme